MNKNEPSNIQVEALFKEFTLLPYAQKLEQFHLHFGIVPLTFPKMNTHISWFYEEPSLHILKTNLNEEIRNRYLYEKSFAETGNIMLFDIKPRSQRQRIQYNTFLLSVFSSESYAICFQTPETWLTMPEEQFSFLMAKRKHIRSILSEIKLYLLGRDNKPSLKHQFARVFYFGYSSCLCDKKINLQVRHKFVELYLYSQGVIMGYYLSFLQNLIEKIDIPEKNFNNGSFRDIKRGLL